MTTVQEPQNLDKFGLQPAESPDTGAEPPRPGTPSGWVPIRDLHARHRHRILDHLLQLDAHDRYLRFGSHIHTEQLSKYVASIDFKRDEVFGIFNRKLHLVAVAHLAAMPGVDSARGHAMEFGASVLPEARGKGMGLRLFQHAITHARNRGASHLMIHALTENAPMLRIAAKCGAAVERDGMDAEAWLKLPPDTVGSHLDSSLQSLAAEVIYRVKYRVMHVSDWLRMMLSTG
ncbi:MAG: N-acetyltransferase family protein [Acidobacteriota bacterium]